MVNLAISPPDEPAQKIGVNVSALFRNMLNEHGIDWHKCEELGTRFNSMVESFDWLSTDTGVTFEPTFKPE